MAGVRVISGRCRIEARPIGGQAVVLDGLRLKLDLRLGPTPADPAPTERIFTGRKSGQQASAVPAYQQHAMLAAVAALVTAVAVWCFGTPSESGLEEPAGGAPGALAASPGHAEAAVLQAASPDLVAPEARPSVEPAAAPAPPSAELPSPLGASKDPAPPSGLVPAVPVPSTATAGAPPSRPVNASRPRPPAPRAAVSAVSAAPAAPSAAPRAASAAAPAASAPPRPAPRAAAPRSAEADLLYLFGDTK